jgi:hypothetical protein
MSARAMPAHSCLIFAFMNLRFSQNSIRVRVRKPDIEALRQEQTTSETVNLPGVDALLFSLETQERQDIGVVFEKGRFRILLPGAAAATWMDTEQVSMEASLDTPGGPLKVSVEKDFPCQHQPTDNPEDTFKELVK